MQRGVRRLGFRSWTLAALVLASAALIVVQAANSTLVATGSSSTSGSVCAATSCKLSNGGTCNRTVAGCPVCVEFQAASNVYTCTTILKATKACPDGFSVCSSAATPSPSPSLSSSTSSSSSTLGQVRAANTSSDGNNGESSQSESGQLHTASVATDAPDTTVSTGTSDSGSSFPTWIVIGAGTIVGCIIAAVVGTKYAARKNRRNPKNDRDSDGRYSSTKGLDEVFDESDGGRNTTAIDFSASALDLNSTTSKASYTSVDRSTRAAEGAVFHKSDSWRHTNTSSQSVGPTPVPAPMPAPVLAPPPAPLSFHSFRGSQHVSKMLLDDLQGPLDASQLTTEAGKSYRSEAEAGDTFGMSPHSEWMSSGFYDGSDHSAETDIYNGKISILGDDDDGGNGSGNTEFYSSKISVLGDHDDDDFLRRKSERVEDESVAKWKQKFYVEL